jgi:hypothetical protein
MSVCNMEVECAGCREECVLRRVGGGGVGCMGRRVREVGERGGRSSGSGVLLTSD